MVRTALAVLFSMLFFGASAIAAEEITPATSLLASSATTGLVRMNVDLAKSFDATASPLAAQTNTTTFAASVQKRPTALLSMYAGLIGLQSYDVYSTTTALKHGGVEANSAMGGVVSHPAAFIAVKAGMTSMSIFAAERLWKQHRRGAAIAVMAISNGIMSAVAAHNASVLSTLR